MVKFKLVSQTRRATLIGAAILTPVLSSHAQNIVAPQAAQTQVVAVDGTPITISGAGIVQMAATGDAIVLTSNVTGTGVSVTLNAGTQLNTAAGASGIGINLGAGTVTNNGTIFINGIGNSSAISIDQVTGGDITNNGTILVNALSTAAPNTPAAGLPGTGGSDGIRVDFGNIVNNGTIITHDTLSAAAVVNPAQNNVFGIIGFLGGNITNNGTVTTHGSGSPALVNNVTGDITNAAAGVITTNGGTAALPSDGIFFGNGGGSTGTNAGTININGFGSGINVGGAGDTVINTGTINLNGASNSSHAGILSTTNGGNNITHTGTITISAAAAGAHGISVSSGDSILLGAGGGTINVNGANSNAINSTGGATITNSSTINVAAAGSIGINVAGNDTVNYSGTMNVASAFSGIFSNGGGNTINASGTINMTAGLFFAISGISVNGNDTVNHSGTINGAAGVVTGILAAGAGNTINNSGNIIMAGTGTGISATAATTITNSGTITTAAGNGINDQVVTGSIITNAAGGTININGGGALIHGIDSRSTSITNAGTINIASAGSAINAITAGATVTNSATSIININGAGNALASTAGANFSNAGTININGAGSVITTVAGDNFTNTGTINIVGAGNAVNATGGATVNSEGGTVNMNNAGGAHAFNLTGGGNNVTSGNVTMTGAGNVFNSAGGNSINNSGTILLNGGTVFNTSAAAPDSITNSGTISITAANPGTVVTFNGGQAHSFTNSGTIADSVTAGGSGIITGTAGATISNIGTITDSAGGATGAADAIVTGGATTSNTGTITLDGGGFGIFANAAGGAISNSGTITTTGAGSFGMTENSGNTINNTGTIMTTGAGAHGIAVNSAVTSTMNIGGTINASGAGSSAIFSFTNFARTLNINAATLSSGSAQVIQLGNANDVVNLQGRVNITGTIDGGGAGADMDTLNFSDMRLSQALINQLQAATGTPAGSVQLFGSTVTWNDFETVTVDLDSIVSYSSLLTSPETRSFGMALDSVSTFDDADLVTFLNAFDAIPVADLEASALQVIGQDNLQAFSTIGISTATQFTNSFMRRLPALIGSGGGIGSSNFSVLDASLDPLLASTQKHLAYNSSRLSITDSASLGLATAAASTATGRLDYQDFYPDAEVSYEPKNRFVAEVVGSGTIANQDATSDRPESNYFVTTATLRAGYRVNQDTTVGAYMGYNGGEAETDAFGSELEYQGGHAGIFGQYNYRGFRFVGLAGYTYSNYDSDRVISIPGINRVAEGETDSNQVIAATEVAYDFILGPNHQWKVTPIVGLQYTHMWIDGYQESGAGALSLNVGDQEVDSLQTKIGFEASKLWQYDGLSHITFFANAFWHHEILDNNRTVDAAFNSTAINSFTVQTEDPERDFAIIGAGLDAVPFDNQDVHILLGYQNQFGQDGFMSHTLYGGYRRDF